MKPVPRLGLGISLAPDSKAFDFLSVRGTSGILPIRFGRVSSPRHYGQSRLLPFLDQPQNHNQMYKKWPSDIRKCSTCPLRGKFSQIWHEMVLDGFWDNPLQWNRRALYLRNRQGDGIRWQGLESIVLL